MKKIMIAAVSAITFGIMFAAGVASAVESSKPETHDGGWIDRHGKVSRADESECLSCHTDRISCIECHQDTKPRDHTSAYVYKGHGLKSQWSRESCVSCHTDSSFCDECHLITAPSTHRRGWGGNLYNADGSVAGRQGRHCTMGCHSFAASGMAVYGNDRVTRRCKTCHQTLERTSNGTHPPN
ncbi:MAG: hypothetical protein LBD73_02195 [Deferribacteraceae bacterium]|jgi:hypothetical protein|nr:hypothetical protein [Deferribacteraceae bacterium]